jgi:integrase
MGRAYLRGGVWYLDWADGLGRRQRRATTAQSKREAQALLSELEAQAQRAALGLDASPVYSRETVAQLVEWYLTERYPEASKLVARQQLTKHVVTPLGHLRLSQATADVWELRFEEMAKAGLKPATINRVRTSMHAAFAAARKPPRRWHGENPLAATSPRRVQRVERPTLTPEQVELVIPMLPEYWRGAIACAAYLGLRKGEILALRKSDYSPSRQTLLVAGSHQRRTTKGGRIDTLPVPSLLQPHLEAALRTPGTWLFPDAKGNQRGRETDPHLVLRRACAAAGIAEGWTQWCARCVKAGDSFPRVTRAQPPEAFCHAHGRPMRMRVRFTPLKIRLHDLRHSAATNLIKAGVPLAHVQRILRHASIRTTVDTYAHLEADDLRASVELAAPSFHLLRSDALVSGSNPAQRGSK